ncbi:MAG: RNA-binding cell elongation regulator Jag/EloR [Niameybacter sp.]|uniref:RNA-binding cell elongation regulator Jag/EloR n=1 Tax=Niameybacter sp. TaxID=2033640 RepID=UPI002FC75AAA
MMSVEKTGKTIDDAITDALIEIGATTEQVDIEVLDKGSKGFLGLGAKYARVRVTLKELSDTQDKLQSALEKDVLVEIEETIKEDLKENDEVNINVNVNIDTAIQISLEFLKSVLKEMDIEPNFETKIEKDRVYINISGDKMGMVIGKRGDTLDALQYLTNIVVNKGHNDYVKVMLDTENYRSRREETLRKVAYKFAKKATQTKRPVILEPMNPYDRRIIHAALQESHQVKTHSEGKEPFRRVVITPLNINKSYK